MGAKEEAETQSVVRLAELLATSRRTLALTGPGISLEAGIPGVWGGCGSIPPLPAYRFVSMENYRLRPEKVWPVMVELEERIRRAQPTPAHRALAQLEASGLCDGIITTTIDTLHELAGSTKVLHLHGTIDTLRCLTCRKTQGRNGACGTHQPPRCTCGGLVKHDVSFAGEVIPPSKHQKAMGLLSRCQLLLCIGVSGSLPPVSHLVNVVASGGGRVVTLDPGVTSFPISLETLHLPSPFFQILPLATEQLAAQ